MKNILIKPLISEKSFGKTSENKYTFIVDRSARKNEIAASCHDLFNVTVLGVNVSNRQGKVKRTKKGEGKRSDIKKAVITLKKGDKINLFEFEKEEKKK